MSKCSIGCPEGPRLLSCSLPGQTDSTWDDLVFVINLLEGKSKLTYCPGAGTHPVVFSDARWICFKFPVLYWECSQPELGTHIILIKSSTNSPSAIREKCPCCNTLVGLVGRNEKPIFFLQACLNQRRAIQGPVFLIYFKIKVNMEMSWVGGSN